jgi:hypothetical protein
VFTATKSNSGNVRKWLVMLVCCASVWGCAEHSSVPRGKPIAHVQSECGMPDVISDASGDLVRFYTPERRPKEEWPAEAPRTFYYMERNLAVTFVLGKAVSSGPINDERREVLNMHLGQIRK